MKKYNLAKNTAITCSTLLSILTKSAATSLPGLIAQKICPDFIALSSNFVKEKIITITGTNGKTTTANFLSHILKTNNNTVVHNEKGANMPNGIATAMATSIKKGSIADYFTLEVDEGYLSQIFDSIKSDYLLVTNLFRDQLDRYGELKTTFNKIQTAIQKNNDLTLILNADDPLVTSLKGINNAIFYGFSRIEYVDTNVISKAPEETVRCTCKREYQYSKKFFSHLGHYHCECTQKRPTPDADATLKVFSEYSQLKIDFQGKIYAFKIPLQGVYNAYNALAAITTALVLRINPKVISTACNNFKTPFGRSEKVVYKGKNLLFHLIKNPTGAGEVLKTVDLSQNNNLLILINDDFADGRDVSWLWDSDFEILNNFKGKLFLSGNRALDMALRLKYAGFNETPLITDKNIKKTLAFAVSETDSSQTLTILSTYTALLQIQKYVKSKF